MTDPDRAQYLCDNAVAIVTDLEARIVRYKNTITALEKSRADMRGLLTTQAELLAHRAEKILGLLGFIQAAVDDLLDIHPFAVDQAVNPEPSLAEVVKGVVEKIVHLRKIHKDLLAENDRLKGIFT